MLLLLWPCEPVSRPSLPSALPPRRPRPRCLQGNHIFTSGATGTNAAVIRGALRAERPELLTVVLPQSMDKQPAESQELLQNSLPPRGGYGGLGFGAASGGVLRRLLALADDLAPGLLETRGVQLVAVD